MLAVLGLVPAEAPGLIVHDLVHHFLAAGGGQAVHELGIGAGGVHQVPGHLVLRAEHVHVVLAGDLLVVEAVPHVGVDEVGALDAGDVVGDGDGAAGDLAVLLADGHKLLAERLALLSGAHVQGAVGDLVALGAELHEVHAHLRGDEHEGHAHLGGVADEGELAVLDLLARGQVLDHGHEVAELLGGVVELAHAVDDRRRGELGEVHHVLVAVDAGHEDVDEASHDAAGVLDGLVSAQLDGAGAEELRVAAQIGHGRLEGDAGAGGHLLEDHAQGLVLQQQRVLAALLDEALHGDGEVHHAEQLLLGEVVSVDVILNHGNLLS